MVWARVAIAVFLVSAVLVSDATPSSACSCLDETGWDKIERGPGGLVGTIVDRWPTEENDKIIDYEIEVDAWYKLAGPPIAIVRISHDSSDGCSSDRQHSVNARVAFAVGIGKETYTSFVCSGISTAGAAITKEAPPSGIAEFVSIGRFNRGVATYHDGSGSALAVVPLPAVLSAWSVCPGQQFATALTKDREVVVFDAVRGVVESWQGVAEQPIGETQVAAPHHATCLDAQANRVTQTACPDARDTGGVDPPRNCPGGLVYLAEAVVSVGERETTSDLVPLLKRGSPDVVVDESVGDFGGGFFGSLFANPSRTRFVIFRPNEQGRATLLVSNPGLETLTTIDTPIDRQPIWVDDNTLLIERFRTKALLDIGTGAVTAELGTWDADATTLIGDNLWGVTETSFFMRDLTSAIQTERSQSRTFQRGTESLWPVAQLGIDTLLLDSRPPDPVPFLPLEPIGAAMHRADEETDPTSTEPQLDDRDDPDSDKSQLPVAVGVISVTLLAGFVLWRRRSAGDRDAKATMTR